MAVCLIIIVSVVAIALDGGMLLQERRHAQATADAAALAGADDLFKNYGQNAGADPNGAARASALAIAAQNGYTNDGTTSVVTVSISPEKYQDGSNKGKALPSGYVEVIVQYNQTRSFSNIFGSGPIPVRARAVARGRWEPQDNGIIILDLHAKASLNVTGNGPVNVAEASIIVNSDHPQAAVATGSGDLTAPTFQITGVPGTLATGSGRFIGTINSGVPPTPDPLRHLPEPDPSTLPTAHSGNTLNISSVPVSGMTLSPGVYHKGISISAPGPGTITLLPGIYYMDGGGFRVTGSANIVGNGVMIYNAPNGTGDVVTITGPGSVTLTPPTSGPYKGMAIFQDRTATAPLAVTGNGSMNISGTFYAANALLTVTGQGGTNVIGSQYISRFLKVTGPGSFKVNWNPDLVVPVRTVQLVE